MSLYKWRPCKPCVYLCTNISNHTNARVGVDSKVLNKRIKLWYKKMDKNGQILLQFCCYYRLRMTNTYFQNNDCHNASWRQPKLNQWHQLNLVITRRDSLNNVCNTRAYHGADYDWPLISSKVKLKPKNHQHSKKKSQLRINTSKIAYSDKTQKFLGRPADTFPNASSRNRCN